MGMLGVILLGIGGIVALVGWVMLIIQAFRKSALWGIGSILISPVALVFAIMNWQTAKRPFLIEIAGVVLIILGSVLGGMGMNTGEASALFLAI
jgi:hypothetical protein